LGEVDILCGVVRGIALIPVAPVTEPADFDHKVRVPGTAFLKTTPNPTGHQWRQNQYWRRALDDLLNVYKGICAYCASWTKRATAATTPQDSSIDHFVPKSVAPTVAYEWDNFRLCRGRLNTRKASHQDVLDPFTLAKGWFKLDFLTFRIVPNSSLPAEDRARVEATVNRLQLNLDNDYVTERVGAIRSYCLGAATLTQLANRYPFIAAEMTAQEFDKNFLPRMKAFFSANP